MAEGAKFAETGLGAGRRDVLGVAVEGEGVGGEGRGAGGGGVGAEVVLGEGDGEGGVGGEVEGGIAFAPVSNGRPVLVGVPSFCGDGHDGG